MIETTSAYLSKLDKDTVKIVFKPNAFLTTVEYKSLYDHYKQLLGKDDEMKFLVIVQEGFKMENKYLRFFKKDYRTDFKKAEAFVVLNPASRMFFKIGVQVIPHSYEAKLFEKEEEAIEWLNQIQ
jgi:SpoIIAA-like